MLGDTKYVSLKNISRGTYPLITIMSQMGREGTKKRRFFSKLYNRSYIAMALSGLRSVFL